MEKALSPAQYEARISALEDKLEIYTELIGNSPDLLYRTDSHGRITFVSQSIEKLSGFSVEDVLGVNLAEEIYRYPDQREAFLTILSQNGKVRNFVTQLKRKDGSYWWASANANLFTDLEGNVIGVEGVVRDVTDLKNAEEAFYQEKHFFDQLINSLPGIFYLYDSSLHLQRWNRNHETLLGYSADEIRGKYLGDWHSKKEDRDLSVAASKGIIEDGIELDAVESLLRHKSGREIPFLLTGVRVMAPSGPMLVGVGIDLTERKMLEEQLRQSQKLESIGLLAGGIAHDFNNILTAIMGNIDLGRKFIQPEDPVAKYLDNAMVAANSAGKITRQLLAFSRKDVVLPKVVDLNMALDTMQHMLTRMLGEDIDFRLKQSLELWMVKIDPGQFDQIILNLAVNARDAMPDGGSLIVETENITLDETYSRPQDDFTVGEYVKITVSDTGTGMSQEVLTHLFEPFYTTKGVGRGTGLGLSTTFGAVKQNKGFINVYSEQGLGTTFNIYLPRVKETIEPAIVSTKTGDIKTGGRETIILTEDDRELRVLAEEYLSDLGYRVIACSDGKSALDACIATRGPDLLVTDLIMPEMNGKELAQRMTAIHNNLKVLYISGYTAEILGKHGMLERGVSFLPKPYLLSDLARSIRLCIDG